MLRHLARFILRKEIKALAGRVFYYMNESERWMVRYYELHNVWTNTRKRLVEMEKRLRQGAGRGET